MEDFTKLVCFLTGAFGLNGMERSIPMLHFFVYFTILSIVHFSLVKIEKYMKLQKLYVREFILAFCIGNSGDPPDFRQDSECKLLKG